MALYYPTRRASFEKLVIFKGVAYLCFINEKSWCFLYSCLYGVKRLWIYKCSDNLFMAAWNSQSIPWLPEGPLGLPGCSETAQSCENLSTTSWAQLFAAQPLRPDIIQLWCINLFVTNSLCWPWICISKMQPFSPSMRLLSPRTVKIATPNKIKTMLNHVYALSENESVLCGSHFPCCFLVFSHPFQPLSGHIVWLSGSEQPHLNTSLSGSATRHSSNNVLFPFSFLNVEYLKYVFP